MGDLSGLVIAARKGDSDAFEEVVRRFQDMAVGYAYAALGDWQEAEDAAQEAFIAAWVGLVHLRDAAAFPGWFRQIVHSQAQRRLRVKQPQLVSLEQVAEIAVDDGGRQTERASMADAITAALEALPEAQRTVILLHYMNDFRLHEIAAFLEIPPGTVKSRLYHARKLMKERLTILSELSTQRPSRAGLRDLLAEDSGLAQATTAPDHVLGGGLSPLHLAAQGGHSEVMEALLGGGADVNARDAKGYTPLHFAICFGPRQFLDPLPDLSEAAQDTGVYRLLTDVPRVLVERGADLSARESEKGRTPLELARSPFED